MRAESRLLSVISIAISSIVVSCDSSGFEEKDRTIRPVDIVKNIKVVGAFSECGSVRIYTEDNLFDFIDGGAELYHAYNFREACVKEYHDSQGAVITVEVYEMDRSENAYGVFSFDTDGEQMQIGHEGVYGDCLLRFWKGRLFIRIYSGGSDYGIKNSLVSVAGKIAENIPEVGRKPEILSKLPTDHIIQGSVHYFHESILLNNFYYISNENILHLSERTDAVTYEYRVDEQIMKVILIQYPDSEASNAAYLSFNTAYFSDAEALKDLSFIGEIGEGEYSGIQLVSDYVILVFEAGNIEYCRQLMSIQAASLEN